MQCRGKSKCSVTHLATSPLQACFDTPSKPTRVIKQEVANMPTNKTKANKDPAMAVMASTMGKGETDSTEAMTAVAGITKAAA